MNLQNHTPSDVLTNKHPLPATLWIAAAALLALSACSKNKSPVSEEPTLPAPPSTPVQHDTWDTGWVPKTPATPPADTPDPGGEVEVQKTIDTLHIEYEKLLIELSRSDISSGEKDVCLKKAEDVLNHVVSSGIAIVPDPLSRVQTGAYRFENGDTVIITNNAIILRRGPHSVGVGYTLVVSPSGQENPQYHFLAPVGGALYATPKPGNPLRLSDLPEPLKVLDDAGKVSLNHNNIARLKKLYSTEDAQ